MKKVVIIGGGYGGIKALQTFAKESSNLHITLIDQHTYHYLQTESYDLVASKKAIEETFVYLPTLVNSFGENFQFVHDEIHNIEGKKVLGKNGVYEFDYLIIATGSVTKFLKGFEQKGRYSLGVKSLRSALNIKQYFESELFDRLEPKRAQKKFTIIIIGGGLSGVEIAAEMRAFFNRYVKENALSCGNIHIKLISKHILKNQPQFIQKKVLKRLKQLGIEIVPYYVKEIQEQTALFDNDKKIEFDFAIFAGGISPAPLIQNLSFPKDARGFLIVNQYLQVQNNIYAIGDCALLLDQNKKPIPPTAQSAEQSGIIAAQNILRSIKKRPLKIANIKLRGLAIALGGKYAVVITPLGLVIEGLFGWIIKKGIEYYYKIPLKLKALKGYQKLRLCKGS